MQQFTVKWNTHTISLSVPTDHSVLELKQELYLKTMVLIQTFNLTSQVDPPAQKIQGLLPGGKMAADNALLSSLNLKNPHKLMVTSIKTKKELIGLPTSVVVKYQETEQIAYDEKRKEEELEAIERAEQERIQLEKKQLSSPPPMPPNPPIFVPPQQYIDYDAQNHFLPSENTTPKEFRFSS